MSSQESVNTAILSALDRCLAMQADHLALLETGCLTRISQWVEERQAVVGHLRHALAEAQSVGITQELRDMLLQKLGCILNHEKILSRVAKQQRGSLSDKLSFLRRGKKALHGYGQGRGGSPPQFVSNKQ